MTKPTKPAKAPAITPHSTSQEGANASSPEWTAYIEDFRRAGHETVDWIAQYLSGLSDRPVLAQTRPGELFDALPASAPAQGESFAAIMRDFDSLVMPAVTQWNHPRFFAYFACTGSTPAILGEMLAAALNTNGLHWKTSPAVAELEQKALDWLRQWLGLGVSGKEEWFGIVYDTASTSSMHAIVCAREMVAPEARAQGSHGDLVLYTSDQSHSSIEKGAIAVGIGQNNVRKVPSDGEFRMRADALAEMVAADKAAGKRPFCVVATVGTTSSTSIDPVPAIVEICEQHKLWLHVDAAYGGSAAVVPEMRHILKGCERADSLVLNPHKWLFTPFDLSVLYCRHLDLLRRAFSLVPEYLRTPEQEKVRSGSDYGVQLGRRFRALKLWMIIRYFGHEGLAARIREHCRLARLFASWVEAADDWEMMAPTPFALVCFRACPSIEGEPVP